MSPPESSSTPAQAQPDTTSLLDDTQLSETILQSKPGHAFVDIDWYTTVETLLQPDAFAFNDQGEAIPSLNEQLALANDTSLFDEMNMFAMFQQHAFQVNGSPSSDMLLSSRGPVGTMKTFKMHNPVAQRSANLVLQSLRAFPKKMLSREDPPFFIHSYKHRDTMPEPLAVCSRICHMFDTRTPDIFPFLWRTIRTEELRFINEVCTYYASEAHQLT